MWRATRHKRTHQVCFSNLEWANKDEHDRWCRNNNQTKVDPPGLLLQLELGELRVHGTCLAPLALALWQTMRDKIGTCARVGTMCVLQPPAAHAPRSIAQASPAQPKQPAAQPMHPAPLPIHSEALSMLPMQPAPLPMQPAAQPMHPAPLPIHSKVLSMHPAPLPKLARRTSGFSFFSTCSSAPQFRGQGVQGREGE